MSKPFNISSAYKENDIATADPKQLVVMLYDGAINFLDIAIENMNYTTYDIVNSNIIKVQNILAELMMTLDKERGGEVATNLLDIYIFLNKELLQANMEKKNDRLFFVRKTLASLLEAWKAIDVSQTHNTSSTNQDKSLDDSSSSEATSKKQALQLTVR